MLFSKNFKGSVVDMSEEQLVDRETGEVVRFFRISLYGEADGKPVAFETTGGAALEASGLKRGAKFTCQLQPGSPKVRLSNIALA